MDVKKIKNLIKKLFNRKATPKEELLLLKALNANIEDMRYDVAILKDDLNRRKARELL